MEPKLGSMDFVGKSGTNMNVCWQTNWDLGCSLYVKMVGLTFLVAVHGRSAEHMGAH